MTPREEVRGMFGVRLRLAYDGTDFAGWQVQPRQRTVQSVLEGAVEAMTGFPASVRGASRTDSGVHAEDQVAAFDTPIDAPARGWVMGLNQKLPADVVVRVAEPCPPGYQPRYEASRKRYRYVVLTGDVPDPVLRHSVWFLGPHQRHVPGRTAEERRVGDARVHLDVEAMRRGAAHLLGTHDFRAFCASNDGRENRVRTMFRVDVEPGFRADARLLALHVEGNAFLKNMVRIIAGTLIEIGRGRRDPDSVAAALGPEADRTLAGLTAPPEGLTLERIFLGRDPEARP